MNKTFNLKEKVWLYPGDNPWHFITIPPKTTDEIEFLFGSEKRGWRSLPVWVITGKSRWKTSIFLDSKAGTFMLPLKAEIRKVNNIKVGDIISFSIELGDKNL